MFKNFCLILLSWCHSSHLDLWPDATVCSSDRQLLIGHVIKRCYIIGCNSIPQGTTCILGPLLLLINAHDLPQHCDTTAESYVVADDAKTFNYTNCWSHVTPSN